MIDEILKNFSDKALIASNIVAATMGILITAIVTLVPKFIKNYKTIIFRINLWICKEVRFSISYLFRINIDGQYLLIKGNRINQYQPVGGVYKYYDSAKHLFNKLEVHSDTNITIDEDNKKDLRVKIKGKNAYKLMKWFDSRKNREICIIREFYEELISEYHLDESFLKKFKAEYVKTYTSPLHYSQHFNCKEVLIADIFEILLDKVQEAEIKKLIKTSSHLILVDKECIERENIFIKGISEKIGAHTKWIL